MDNITRLANFMEISFCDSCQTFHIKVSLNSSPLLAVPGTTLIIEDCNQTEMLATVLAVFDPNGTLVEDAIKLSKDISI